MAISEAIRALGSVPSGKLYASVMGVMSLEQFNKVVDILKEAGVVRESQQHLLTWEGGAR